MRIDKTEALAGLSIFFSHLLKIIRFSDTGLPNDIHMAATVIIGDANIRPRSAIVIVAKQQSFRRNIDRRCSSARLEPFNLRRFSRRNRKMKDARYFLNIENHRILIIEIPENIIIDRLTALRATFNSEQVHFWILELSERILHVCQNFFRAFISRCRCKQTDIHSKCGLARFAINRFHKLLFFRRQYDRFLFALIESFFSEQRISHLLSYLLSNTSKNRCFILDILKTFPFLHFLCDRTSR